MTFFTVHPFHSFNLAVVLLIAGKILTLNIDLLRRYSIPEPVAGGFLCIAVTGLLWALFDLKVSFEVGIRDFLLLVFDQAGCGNTVNRGRILDIVERQRVVREELLEQDIRR